MRLMNAVCAAAVVAAAFTLAPEASAQRNRGQSTQVVVVNYQRVIAESALGRDMAAKLQTIGQQVGTEAQTLAPEQQSLEQERQRLTTASRNMTPEQVRNSTTLAPQFQAFQTRAQQFETRRNALRGDLECSQAIALRDFDRQVSPIVRSVMESRGAGAVLDAANIQLVLPEYDITTTVIQQLDQNQATRTAAVARHPVTECQAQPAAAAAPAQ